MSSGSITISYTTLAEIAVAAAVIGGVALIGSKQISSASSISPVPATSNKSTANGAGKKKKKSSSATAVAAVVDAKDKVVEHVARVEQAVAPQAKQAAKAVADKAQQVQEQVVKPAVEAVTAPSQPRAESPTATATGGKSKKKNKKGGNKTPPQQQEQEKPKAEAAKKDDMRDYELEPEQPRARVMKIVGGDIGADPKDASAGWEKPDAFEDDEGEWESVVSKSKSNFTFPLSMHEKL